MSKPPREKYRTTNWSEYNEALKRRDRLWSGPIPTSNGKLLLAIGQVGLTVEFPPEVAH